MPDPTWPRHALDRARTIARTYRAALLAVAPDAAAQLDQAAVDAGERWATGAPTPPGHQYLSRAAAADLAGVKPDTISAWATRGKLTRYGQGYLVSEVQAAMAGAPRQPRGAVPPPAEPATAQELEPISYTGAPCAVGQGCTGAVPDGMPGGVCVPHGTRIWQYMEDRRHAPGRMEAARAHLEANELRRAATRDLIYYLEVDGLIKIGTTSNWDRRRLGYPPNATLRAMERGGPALEKERHAQFRHLLAKRREWFRMGDDLLEHCAAVAAAWKV